MGRPLFNTGLAAVLLFGFANNTAHAVFISGLINVDLSPGIPPAIYTGAAVIGNAGDYWNGTPVFALNPISLQLEDGAASSVTLQMPVYELVTGSSTIRYGLPGFYGGSSPMSTGLFGALMGDGAGSAYTLLPVVLTFGGLSPGMNYELIAYSYLDTAGSTTFEVDGTTATVTYQTGLSQLVEGHSYAHFQSVTASATGELDVTLRNTTTPLFAMNGFQLRPIAVPEPGRAALLLLAYASACLRRRRPGFPSGFPFESMQAAHCPCGLLREEARRLKARPEEARQR